MQAVLLAAGKSSRFYPYNQYLEQKSLITLMGKTLLEHTLDALVTVGITDVVMVTGPQSVIPQLLSKRKDVKLSYVVLPEPTGMGDALLQAKDYLQDTFFVLSPYHMDIADFAKEMLSQQEDDNAVVLIKSDVNTSGYGVVTLHGDRVTDVIEKPKYSSGENYRIIAMYLLSQAYVHELEKIPREHYHFEKALAVFAKQGHVKAVKTDKPTITLKYAWDVLGVKDYLLQRIETPSIATNASIAKDVSISGQVIVEEGAIIMEGACVKGPAYIGKRVKVGNRAILRGGVIVENEATVGSHMEVKNAIIMEHTTTHSGFIGDSVIGPYTKIAAGFITANARLDRQNVKTIVKDEKVDTGYRHLGTITGEHDNIGIRVSTMPGVIVGNDVIVGPSTTVMKNIPDKTKYYTKFQEVVEENNEAQ